MSERNPEEAHAKRGDPETSIIAAETVTDDLTRARQDVYECLLLTEGRPFIYEELEEAYADLYEEKGWKKPSRSGPRSRCAELRKDFGLVVSTGNRRRNKRGGLEEEWRLA